MAKSKNNTDGEKFLNSIYDYILFLGSCVIVILFVLFLSGIFLGELANSLSNVLFAGFNILASIFVAYKISYFGFHSQEKYLQKKLAKAAIRHLRYYGKYLTNLKTIVEDKKESVNQKIIKQYFTEINNHIEHIIKGVLASEVDIKETIEGLVDEEYKEENEMLGKVQKDLEKLRRLQEKKDSAKEGRIKTIEKEIESLRTDIGDQVTSLPFGYPSSVVLTAAGAVDAASLGGSSFYQPVPTWLPSVGSGMPVILTASEDSKQNQAKKRKGTKKRKKSGSGLDF